MASCCEDKSCEIDALREKHSRVLKIVLIINAAMWTSPVLIERARFLVIF